MGSLAKVFVLTPLSTCPSRYSSTYKNENILGPSSYTAGNPINFPNDNALHPIALN